MSWCLIHAGDLRLDAPFGDVGLLPASLSDRLRDATLDALDGLVALALERRAAILILGDRLWGPDGPTLRARARLRGALERLAAAGTLVVCAPAASDDAVSDDAVSDDAASDDAASDDAASEGGADRELEEAGLLQRMQPDDRVEVTLPGGNDRRVALVCRRDDTSTVPDRGTELLLVCEDGAEADATEATGERVLHVAPVAPVRDGPADARARPGAPAVPGPLQGLSFDPEETGPHGALFVEEGEGDQPVVRFEPLDVVRLARVSLEAKRRPRGGIVTELRKRGEETACQAERPVIARAVLEGSPPVGLAPESYDAELLTPLREASTDSTSRLWWDAIEDRTRPVPTPAEIEERGDFSSDVMALARELAERPEAMRCVSKPGIPVEIGADAPEEGAESPDVWRQRFERSAMLAVREIEKERGE